MCRNYEGSRGEARSSSCTLSSPADGSFLGKMTPHDTWLWKSVARRTGGLWEAKTLLLKGHIQTHLLQALAQRQQLEKRLGHMQSQRRILTRAGEAEIEWNVLWGQRHWQGHFLPQVIGNYIQKKIVSTIDYTTLIPHIPVISPK